ncbi:trehalose 6-phosphate synthase [Actinopolymorpha pittospori]|uniref:Trehalose 6-phosphate synthase n=1 Tax=Actinopolymorpha pittospori TaxID=648752 RepID=A0A927N4Y8_9ACTN|nr:trehalose 6-phosphate synthase [Actinopolymorpha pittospori]
MAADTVADAASSEPVTEPTSADPATDATVSDATVSDASVPDPGGQPSAGLAGSAGPAVAGPASVDIDPAEPPLVPLPASEPFDDPAFEDAAFEDATFEHDAFRGQMNTSPAPVDVPHLETTIPAPSVVDLAPAEAVTDLSSGPRFSGAKEAASKAGGPAGTKAGSKVPGDPRTARSPSRTAKPRRGRSSFVVVANRLPVDRVEGADGTPQWRRSPGGLVTALDPVMRVNKGAWIGWAGSTDEAPEPFDEAGMHLVSVPLSATEVENYYEGFSNATLWPLYHDVIAPPVYRREWWEAYVQVNQRFAQAAAEVADREAVVWIHDYQLQLVPEMLRALRPDLRIGYFLHIPLPPVELFGRLPWRQQILRGLLGADLIGFQRPGAASNFLRLTRRLLGYQTQRDQVFLPDGRVVRARSFPISIDVAELEEIARRPETHRRAEEIREEIGSPAKVLLGIDRLDYTKGIAERIHAFAELLNDGVVSPDEATFIQVATPSRERVEQYKLLRDEVELAVGRVNGTHGRIGRPAVTYLHSSHDRVELAALYRAADVMVVTPLRDGMNLVAKEYVACRYDNTGTLVLSEFAGAADEFRQAFLVNPYDVDGLKSTLVDAIRLDPRTATRKMRSMRRHLVEHDVDKWASSFLTALTGDMRT